MDFVQTLVGNDHKWSLVRKLGEGDAGEVYLAEALLGGQPAIVKRPRKSAFASDSLRQAAQIRTEGKVLAALSRIALPSPRR